MSSTARIDDRLLAAHYLPVMRLCLSRLRDPSDAEDATQEVFRRALQHAGGLRDDPLPWLITVAKNVCNDELRRRRRQAGMSCPDEPRAAAAPPDATPEGVVVGRMAVMELLGRLTPGERRALSARLAGGGDPSPTSTTRVLLARARQKLRQHLEDSQSALGTATVSSAEALHRLRSRLLGRTLLGSGRVAALVPAALIIGVAGGPGGAMPAIGGIPGTSPAPLSLAPLDAGLTRHDPVDSAPGSRSGVRQINVGALRAAAPGAPAGGALLLPPPSGPTWTTQVQQEDYHQVSTSDIEPSPAYGSDHTVLMIGQNHQCGAAICSQIYRSGDGGATWTFVTGMAVTDTQAVLPQSFSAGHFYTAGSAGVELTKNSGATFATVLPNENGTAMVPPPASGLDVVYSTSDGLWGVGRDGSPTLLSLLNAGDDTGGTPVLFATPSGFTVLQPVAPPATSRSTGTYLERCSPQCGPDVPLPLPAAHFNLFASADVATDHTVYANDGMHLGVSHDDGQTFTVIPGPNALDILAIRGPSGRRLVGSLGMNGHSLGYSDDDGATWQPAAIPNSVLINAQTITQLRPGRLIASMMRSDDWGWYYFVCSSDGATWTACSPDSG
ncbi:MAG TPA: sigma factor [Candidatus Angelobacter sp.]|jgi:DNA-directed RNA polymerase specialized sigma24 family protein|nr:sigma factor [Candidatus Angelobacter sp.]